jgi:uncharacterized coiled-coil DUF342 family protein
MRDDLENYKRVAQMSKELATYYSPFTPLQKYKREILIKLPQIKSEIIDLKEAMQETSSNIDILKKEIKELTTERDELLSKNKVMTRQNDEMVLVVTQV